MKQTSKKVVEKPNKPVIKRQVLDTKNSAYPVVSHPIGDGFVSMDGIWSNENELYSMCAITGSSNFSSMHSLSNVSSSLFSKSTRILAFLPTPPVRNDSIEVCGQVPDWFFGAICREAAINVLNRKPIGAFVVRVSTTSPGSFVLSVRVPNNYRVSGVAHYLIVRGDNGTFRIKGFGKEFNCLHSLIVHHSIMKELLPFPLTMELSANQCPDWFYRSICREAALEILCRKPVGAFLVRASTTNPDCFALSVRVPNQFRISGVAHYLIVKNDNQTFKIKGFNKEFQSLQSLIVHHSKHQESFPCPLKITDTFEDQ